LKELLKEYHLWHQFNKANRPNIGLVIWSLLEVVVAVLHLGAVAVQVDI
jgi:hypothetical protein